MTKIIQKIATLAEWTITELRPRPRWAGTSLRGLSSITYTKPHSGAWTV
ncbi:MAG: hypothetical protein VCE91_12910 [Nitrospinota bacterium]